jgi:hypothetical protein
MRQSETILALLVAVTLGAAAAALHVDHKWTSWSIHKGYARYDTLTGEVQFYPEFITPPLPPGEGFTKIPIPHLDYKIASIPPNSYLSPQQHTSNQ